ncbi:MAG TPA: thioredoxin domain-containing protein [Pyrinomonadaceae bacterium]|jgi:protein-disulfide isomerase|nr:thioredoxin domain-containing protein [Pyrinomonadaceae bacterium]
MSKFFYAIILTLAVACSVAAQTRRTTPTTSRPQTSNGAAAKPTPSQTPATKTTPAQQQRAAAAQPVAAASGGADEDCGCEDKPLPGVLAVVNGVKITQADFSPEVQQQIKALQQQVTDARKYALDAQINSLLLEAEAKKRGVSSQKLYETEVVAKTVEPTQAEAQAFFNQNKAQIEQQAGSAVDFALVKDQVIAFIRSQRQDEQSKKFADSLRAAANVKLLVKDVTPPATPADRARVLATVNGKNITAGDIEEGLRPLVSQVQQQVYLLRRNDLDLRVNDILLTQEAQKRSVTTRALLDSEITSKIPVITEAQAQDFYNKNKERITGDFPTVKYQLIEFLQQQEQQKLEGALAQRLRNGASVQTFITPPEQPVFQIATDDQPTKGKADSAVTVVEFTDYQCPVCAQAQPVLDKLIAEYGDRVRFVVRDFPLSQHKDAEKAAEAAEAAREQGKYWDFTAILFRNQSALGADQLKQYAGVIGLDRKRFDAALDSGKFAGEVERDMRDGEKIGVNATPTFFVNGRQVPDRTYEALKAAIEASLKSSAQH